MCRDSVRLGECSRKRRCQDLVEEETLDLSSVFTSQTFDEAHFSDFLLPNSSWSFGLLMDVYDFKQMAKTTRHDPGSTWCWTRPSFSPWDIIPSETNTEKDIIFQLQVNSKVYGCACSHLLVLLSMFRVCSMQIKDRRGRFRFVLKPQHVLHSMCWHKVDIYI